LLRANAADAICPHPGITFTAAVNPSYAISAICTALPYFPPYSLDGPFPALKAAPTTFPANAYGLILDIAVPIFDPVVKALAAAPPTVPRAVETPAPTALPA